MIGRSNDAERDELAQLVHEAVEMTPVLLDPAFPVKAALWPPHGRKVDALASRWDALCDSLLAHARASTPPEGPRDVLHQLLSGYETGEALLEDDDALREELRGLLLSAHETTALALAWTLHELAHDPAAYAVVLDELDTVLGGEAVTPDRIRELPRTRAAFEEALRLRGGTFIPRGAEADLDFDHAGIRVPRGAELLASMWVTHRDERWWDTPEAYRPDRFATPDPDRPRFAWFPCGGGRRTCIGMHLAVQSAVVVLAELHRRWRLEPLADDPPVAPYSNVLVRPTRPIMLVPTLREPA
jgi:cytochrome P450